MEILSQIKLKSAYETDPKQLKQFYRKVYPGRVASPERLWKWLYRSDFHENKIPIVAVLRSKIIAHAGMIPFHAELDGQKYTAAWYIDLAILPKYQRMGLGTLLTRKWMEFSDIHVTFCNEKSIGVFKKLGWMESFNTHLHYFFVKPFDDPRFVGRVPDWMRSALNIPSQLALKWIHMRHSHPDCKLHFENINEQRLNLFIRQEKRENPAGSLFSPKRDISYLCWRYSTSPEKSRYFIVSCEDDDLEIVLKKRDDKPKSRHLDILWLPNPKSQESVCRLFARLGLWCSRNGYSYFRFYTYDPELSRFLKMKLKSTVQNPRFAYYSSEEKLFEKLKTSRWRFELMDSDFEFTQ